MNVFDRLSWAVLLGLLAWLLAPARAADITATLPTTGNSTVIMTVRLAVRNDASSARDFVLSTGTPATSWLAGSTQAPTAGFGNVASGVVISPANYVYCSNALNVAPGATAYLTLGIPLAHTVVVSAYTTQTWNVTVPWFARSAGSGLYLSQPGILATASVASKWFANSGSPSVSPSTYTWPPLTVYTGAAPSSGSIQLMPKSAGWVTLKVGGVVKLKQFMAAGQVASWTTSDPAAFNGQQYEISQDGTVYASGTITNQRPSPGNDPEGFPLPPNGYDFTAAHTWYHSGQRDDGDAETPPPAPEVPVTSATSNAPPPTAPGQYSGRDASPQPEGTPDPKTDGSAPDTVKEMYGAVRAGVEDALNGNAGTSGGVVEADTNNAHGTQAGNAVAGGLSAMASQSSVVSVPQVSASTSTGGLVLPFVFGHTVTVAVPDWAPICYWFVLSICTFQFFLCVVRVARAAFATAV